MLLKNINKMIKQDSIPKKKIICSVWKKTFPHRDKNSKWYVTNEEYQENLYPDYCGGFFFLMTNDIIGPLYNEMFYTRFFWVDDVWLTGLAIKEINVTLECRKDMIVEQEFVEKRFIDYKEAEQTFAGHLGYKVEKITELWNYLCPFYSKTNYIKHMNNEYIERFQTKFKSKELFLSVISVEIIIQLILIIFFLIYFLFLNTTIKFRNFHI